MLGITGMRWYFAVALECNSMVVDTLSWRGMVIIREKTQHRRTRISNWYYRKRLHRLDGPAAKRVYLGGLGNAKTWYVDGMRHRLDGPACYFGSGVTEWFLHDKLHRLNGPAVEFYGDKKWYLHGELHRLDGPAVEYANGRKEWWVDDNLHRLGGPAIERPDGANEWWMYGIHQY